MMLSLVFISSRIFPTVEHISLQLTKKLIKSYTHV